METETEREPTRHEADTLAAAHKAARALQAAERVATATVLAAYSVGWTADEIADACDSSPYKVRKAVKAAGCPLWQQGRRDTRLTDAELAAVASMTEA